eukprot:TRINITY_DN1373_c0_g1_i1.p1 TRINITY_DN1373_c0_g1~~TRINITY_DN1373_c0_g1_i1.p1  ORF type:complete len:325 (-),score=39.95 TRINITY_DN1373_c0_g1_i1:220-1194(-)
MSQAKVSKKGTFQTNLNKPIQKTLQRKVSNDYSPISWKQYFDSQEFLANGTSLYKTDNCQQELAIICMHGAGQSALSFACLAKQLCQFAQIFAFDFRGHGDSQFKENFDNLSVETLVEDALIAVKFIIEQSKKKQKLLIVGHSMGGAIAIRAVEKLLAIKEVSQLIKGICVIESIEGTAIEFFPIMAEIIKEKPQKFSCVEQAIQFSYKANLIKNLESARISVPQEVKQDSQNSSFTWRVDLLKSQQYWLGWFKNLNSIFLNLKIPKLILISDYSKLDTDLIIANMQGKFKMSVIPQSNHNIHEDNPIETAQISKEFLNRFRIA